MPWNVNPVSKSCWEVYTHFRGRRGYAHMCSQAHTHHMEISSTTKPKNPLTEGQSDFSSKHQAKVCAWIPHPHSELHEVIQYLVCNSMKAYILPLLFSAQSTGHSIKQKLSTFQNLPPYFSQEVTTILTSSDIHYFFHS